MRQKKDHEDILQEFRMRQSRQFLAMAVTLVLLLFLVVIYKRHDLFGEIPKDTIFTGQILVIGVFIGFSAFNWRCPVCNKYLGPDINRRICKKCGAKLREG
jgi:predicted nucleic acid-binding Zn ribbon protein